MDADGLPVLRRPQRRHHQDARREGQSRSKSRTRCTASRACAKPPWSACPTSCWAKRIRAYVVVEPTTALNDKQIRASCASRTWRTSWCRRNSCSSRFAAEDDHRQGQQEAVARTGQLDRDRRDVAPCSNDCTRGCPASWHCCRTSQRKRRTARCARCGTQPRAIRYRRPGGQAGRLPALDACRRGTRCDALVERRLAECRSRTSPRASTSSAWKCWPVRMRSCRAGRRNCSRAPPSTWRDRGPRIASRACHRCLHGLGKRRPGDRESRRRRARVRRRPQRGRGGAGARKRLTSTSRPRTEFRAGDLLAPFDNAEFIGQVDLLTCNPPYISSAKVAQMADEIATHEPRLAFDGGAVRRDDPDAAAAGCAAIPQPGRLAGVRSRPGPGHRHRAPVCKASGEWQDVRPLQDEQGAIRVVLAQRRKGTTMETMR